MAPPGAAPPSPLPQARPRLARRRSTHARTPPYRDADPNRRRRSRPARAGRVRRRPRCRTRLDDGPGQPGRGVLRGGTGVAEVGGVQGGGRRERGPGVLRLERRQHRQRRREPPGADPERPAVLGRQRQVPGPGPGPRRLAGRPDVRRPAHLPLQGHGPAQGLLRAVRDEGRLRPVEASEVVRPGARAVREGHRPGHAERRLRVLGDRPEQVRPPPDLQHLAALRQPGGLLHLLGRGLRQGQRR